MRQPDGGGRFVAALGDRGSCRRVREMTVRPRDPLFEEVWVSAGVQQVRIVVGLDDQQVEVAELATHGMRYPAEVSRNGGAAGAGFESKAERLVAIVRHGEGLQVH